MLELRSVSLAYGAFTAVSNVDLVVEKGSFVALLGPSGCGKTTLLRAVAGLVCPTLGSILINGREMNAVPIHKRNIGLVFQNYALFPHKTIQDNIAFGLKYRKFSKQEIGIRVRRALEMVRLPGMAARYPSELSGGQQQRIAIARAIVTEPDVLLLDEPLSALDANLRAEMRSEIRALQQTIGITTVFVTHDQEEALAMADHVVVMNDGRVIQSGTPEEIYRRPGSRFVAEFLGHANIIKGRVVCTEDGHAIVEFAGVLCRVPGYPTVSKGQAVLGVVRSKYVRVKRSTSNTAEAPGTQAIVAERAFLGEKTTYVLEHGGTYITATTSGDDPPFRSGDKLSISFDEKSISLLDAEGRAIDVVGSMQ